MKKTLSKIVSAALAAAMLVPVSVVNAAWDVTCIEEVNSELLDGYVPFDDHGTLFGFDAYYCADPDSVPDDKRLIGVNSEAPYITAKFSCLTENEDLSRFEDLVKGVSPDCAVDKTYDAAGSTMTYTCTDDGTLSKNAKYIAESAKSIALLKELVFYGSATVINYFGYTGDEPLTYEADADEKDEMTAELQRFVDIHPEYDLLLNAVEQGKWLFTFTHTSGEKLAFSEQFEVMQAIKNELGISCELLDSAESYELRSSTVRMINQNGGLAISNEPADMNFPTAYEQNEYDDLAAAMANGERFVDFNHDGRFDAVDSAIVLNYYSWLTVGGDPTSDDWCGEECAISISKNYFCQFWTDYRYEECSDFPDTYTVYFTIDKETLDNVRKYGDVDGDGMIDSVDSSLLLKGYCKRFNAGDVNSDEKTDAADASYILQYYADMSTKKAVDPYTAARFRNLGDLNNDGKIDASDASEVLTVYAENSTK